MVNNLNCQLKKFITFANFRIKYYKMSIENTAVKTVYFSIAGNTSLAIIKGLAGFFGNSFALIADAIAVSYTHLTLPTSDLV